MEIYDDTDDPFFYENGDVGDDVVSFSMERQQELQQSPVPRVMPLHKHQTAGHRLMFSMLRQSEKTALSELKIARAQEIENKIRRRHRQQQEPTTTPTSECIPVHHSTPHSPFPSTPTHSPSHIDQLDSARSPSAVTAHLYSARDEVSADHNSRERILCRIQPCVPSARPKTAQQIMNKFKPRHYTSSNSDHTIGGFNELACPESITTVDALRYEAMVQSIAVPVRWDLQDRRYLIPSPLNQTRRYLMVEDRKHVLKSASPRKKKYLSSSSSSVTSDATDGTVPSTSTQYSHGCQTSAAIIVHYQQELSGALSVAAMDRRRPTTQPESRPQLRSRTSSLERSSVVVVPKADIYRPGSNTSVVTALDTFEPELAQLSPSKAHPVFTDEL